MNKILSDSYLMSKTKKDLILFIRCLENNIQAVESRERIGYQRNLKLVKFLESEGYLDNEISNAMKLDCENY